MPGCIIQGHIDIVAVVQVHISINIATELMVVVEQPMAMHIKLSKSMFWMAYEGIVTDLLISLAGVGGLGVSTSLSMHHQISNSLVIDRDFKAESFNKSLDYNLQGSYRMADSMNIS